MDEVLTLARSRAPDSGVLMLLPAVNIEIDASFLSKTLSSGALNQKASTTIVFQMIVFMYDNRYE